MEPGQYLCDRWLRQKVKTGETYTYCPQRVFRPAHPSFVLAGRAAHQLVADGINRTSCKQEKNEEGDFKGPSLPGLFPGGHGALVKRPTADQITVRQPQLTRKTDKLPVAGCFVEFVGEKYQLPRISRRKTRIADNENGRLTVGRRARYSDAVKVEVVEIAESKCVEVLRHLNPVENTAPHKAGPFERLHAIGDQENCMFVGGEFFHQPAVIVFTENRLADGRHVQVAEANINVRLLWRRWQTHLIVAYRKPLNAAFLFHRRPVGGRSYLRIGHRWPLHRLDDADLPRDCHRRACHHLILCNDRYGCATNCVKPDDTFTGLPLAHLDLAPHRLADVLIDECHQFFFGNAEQQNGFGVAQYTNACEQARGVHANQCDNGFAGIGRDIDDVSGQKYIADKMLVAILCGISLDVKWAAFTQRKTGSTGRNARAGDVLAQIRVAGHFRRECCVVGERRRRG